MEITGTSVPVKSQDIVFRQVDDETLFVPIRRNASDLQSIFTTNVVGTRIWELMDGRSVEAIVEAIASEYEVSQEEARRDAMSFFEQLREAGCISVASDSSA